MILFQRDGWDVLGELEPGSVAAIVTDPPYGAAGRGIVMDSQKKVVDFNLAFDRTLAVAWIAPRS